MPLDTFTVSPGAGRLGTSSAQDKAKAAAAAAALPATGAPAASDPAQIDKGRDLFTNYGCGNCHTLGDAGATGHVGPALDGNANLSQDFVVNRVTNGQGMMGGYMCQVTHWQAVRCQRDQ